MYLSIPLLLTDFYLNIQNQYSLYLFVHPGILAPPQHLSHVLCTPFCFCKPSCNDLFSCIWHMSSHMLDTVGVHVSHHNTCMLSVCGFMHDSILPILDCGATLTLLNWHVSMMSSKIMACALCASTLFVHTSTPSLVVCLSLLLIVSSLIISPSMPLSFKL